MLNSQVAVVTVPESQLFAVQQSQQADSVQQETGLTSEDDVTSVTGSASNVSDPNELALSVTLQPHSASLSEDGGLPEGAPSSTPGDPKVTYMYRIIAGGFCVNLVIKIIHYGQCTVSFTVHVHVLSDSKSLVQIEVRIACTYLYRQLQICFLLMITLLSDIHCKLIFIHSFEMLV